MNDFIDCWSPASDRIRDEAPEVGMLRECLAHAFPGVTVIVNNASPAVIAWVRAQPRSTFGYTASGDFLTANLYRDRVTVTATARRGERGWIEPDAKELPL